MPHARAQAVQFHHGRRFRRVGVRAGAGYVCIYTTRCGFDLPAPAVSPLLPRARLALLGWGVMGWWGGGDVRKRGGWTWTRLHKGIDLPGVAR